MESGGTLTIELYLQMQNGKYDIAFGVGCVLIALVMLINLLMKIVPGKYKRSSLYGRKRYGMKWKTAKSR